jgi:hypothetical protein
MIMVAFGEERSPCERHVLVLPRYHFEETPQARTGSGRPGSIPLPGLFHQEAEEASRAFPSINRIRS